MGCQKMSPSASEKAVECGESKDVEEKFSTSRTFNIDRVS